MVFKASIEYDESCNNKKYDTYPIKLEPPENNLAILFEYANI